MARKKNEHVVLEDVELKPQVIGYSYQKKSNLGRVIFIFIILILVVFYINDISVFINDLLGKQTASSITENQEGNDTGDDQPSGGNTTIPNENEDDEYKEFSESLEIKNGSMVLNNFKYVNGVLTFDVNNDTTSTINLKGRKFFIETFSQDKTLLDRFKIDIETITSKNKESYSLNVAKAFYYVSFNEKTTKDYPEYTLKDDGNGKGMITCEKDLDSIIYNFENKELKSIKHTISSSNTTSSEYNKNYNDTQDLINNYKNLEGVTATFNGSANGFSAVITIDLQKADLSKLNNKYYYAYKEVPGVVNFELITYGFNCK